MLNGEDLGHVAGSEDPWSYCSVIESVLNSRLPGHQFQVYPRSAPRADRVPPGCFTAEVQIRRGPLEPDSRFETAVHQLKNLIGRFDLEETQPSTGGNYLYDGSDEQPPRAIEDRSRSDGDWRVGVVFLVYANPTLIRAEEIERQAAARERSDRMDPS